MTKVGHPDTGPAPGELELVRRFVNSWDAELEAEALSSPAGLSAWLDEAGLSGGAGASEADLTRVIEAREALRELLLANNTGDAPSPATLERMNEAFAGRSLEIRFDREGYSSLVPRERGVDGALARIAAIVREAMVTGEWQRLKACPAEDCQWAFYDRSRNRSRTWCMMEVCGNRAKVRNFRGRH
jgi:predicted RNA-binding Zn ribbon-like protein